MDAPVTIKPAVNLNVAHRFFVAIEGNGATTYVNLKELLKEKRLKEIGDKKELTEKDKQNSPKKEVPPKESVEETPVNVDPLPIIESQPTDSNTPQQPTTQGEVSLDVDGEFEEEELSDDNDEDRELIGKNRMTSVIEKIERAYADKGTHHGYDAEDSFIDDEDAAEASLDGVETNYGGFFIHKGEVSTRKNPNAKKKEDEKPKRKRKPREKEPSEEATREGGKKNKKKEEKKEDKDGESKPKEDKPAENVPSETTSNKRKESPNAEEEVSAKPAPKKKKVDSSSKEVAQAKLEAAIQELKIEAEKVLQGSTKPNRFPKQLDPFLNKVLNAAKEDEGKLTQALMDRLCQFLPFKKETLKTRFKKNSNQSDLPATLQDAVSQLRVKIESMQAAMASGSLKIFADKELSELVYTITNTQMNILKLNVTETKISVPEETRKYLAKIALLWPPQFPTNAAALYEIYEQVRDEKKKEKETKTESKKQEKGPSNSGSPGSPPLPISARRKTESPSLNSAPTSQKPSPTTSQSVAITSATISLPNSVPILKSTTTASSTVTSNTLPITKSSSPQISNLNDSNFVSSSGIPTIPLVSSGIPTIPLINSQSTNISPNTKIVNSAKKGGSEQIKITPEVLASIPPHAQSILQGAKLSGAHISLDVLHDVLSQNPSTLSNIQMVSKNTLNLNNSQK